MADDGITSSRDLELGLQIVAEELEPATATSKPKPDHIPSRRSHNDSYMADQEKLCYYASQGDWESAKFICDRYPEMMRLPLNEEGRTALQIAVLYNKKNFVGQLIERMTPKGRQNQDKDGDTALHLASYNNDIDCCQLLVERMTTEELKIQNKDGNTALHSAGYKNNIFSFQLLVQRMTIEDMKIQNNYGDTALHIAVYYKNIECFIMLVQRMTTEELKIQNNYGVTALHIAAQQERIHFASELIERMTPKDLQIENNNGETPLHVAVYCNNFVCFRLLVERMTTEKLKIQYKSGNTILHIAVYENSIECFQLLVEYMTTKELKIQNSDGNTALHIAAQFHRIHLASKLIEHMTPKDLQIQNNDGDTALHVAVRNKNIEFLLLLVKAERMTAEDLQIQNVDGNTTLHLAQLKKINLEQMFFMTISHNMYDVADKLFDMYPADFASARDDKNEPADVAGARDDKKKLTALHMLARKDGQENHVADKLFDMYPADFASARDDKNEPADVAGARDDKRKLTALHVLARKDGQENLTQVKQMEKDQLFKKLWTQVRQLGAVDREKMLDLISNPSPVLLDAVQSGNTDVVKWILGENPKVLDEIKYSTKGQNLLHWAALYRQKSIFDFILEIKTADLLESEVDNDGNNALHIAAHYKPKASAKLRPNIEMERELKWFKEAGNKLPPLLRTKKNKDGKTPRDIFYADHSEVCKEVKDAAKGISDSGMIVATLIVSVAFAAAVSVPGEKTSNWFIVFILADAVALLTSATSIICFLSIFTSARSNESEYIISTQPTLYQGLKLVLISIGAMIVAFVAASFLIFENRSKWAAYAVTSLCGYPIYMFLRLQIFSPSDVLHDNYFSGYMYRLFRASRGRAP